MDFEIEIVLIKDKNITESLNMLTVIFIDPESIVKSVVENPLTDNNPWFCPIVELLTKLINPFVKEIE